MLVLALIPFLAAASCLSRLVGSNAPKTIAVLQRLDSAGSSGVTRDQYLSLVSEADADFATEKQSMTNAKLLSAIDNTIYFHKDAARKWSQPDLYGTATGPEVQQDLERAHKSFQRVLENE